MESIKEYLTKYDISYEKVVISDYEENIEKALIACTEAARVIIFAFEGQFIRQVLLTAFDLNLIDGNYAFIAINTRRSGHILEDEQWSLDDGRDSDAKTAYEALLWIRLYEPQNTRYTNFLRDIQLRSFQTFQLSELETHQIEYSLAAFHDAVILYADALNETLTDGGDITDGLVVVDKLRQRDFYLHYGVFDHVTINANLDREADYSLWDMTQTDCGEFTVVANFRGISRSLLLIEDVVWPVGASAPPNSVPFGDPGLSTLSIYSIAIGATVFTCLIFFGMLAAFFRYKRMVADVEAQKTAWKIKWDDLTFSSTTRSLAKSYATMSLSESTPYLRSTSGGSDKSYPSINVLGGEFRDTACSIALYENRQVVVKCINKVKVNLNTGVCIELKANRLAEHENIARFFGACVEEPNVAIVHQYCPRGSLKDFIQTGTVEADVKDILMIDIAKGLHYLHNSQVGCHGRLHWNNCVIDSRFVVQLTDYGLYEFRLGEDNEAILTPEYMESKIWLSPEHLRNKGLGPSQKADIYAMGLLLQVIITASRPYDQPDMFFTSDQIIEKVKFNTAPYFRPVVAETLCRDTIRYCMERCWGENPTERPTSAEVLKSVKRGRKVQNIVDQLLNRMEKYANKLEALVEERTDAFLEEKKRAENLLYEVLPRTVAKQLMQGTFVEPESYTSVTICFSDVVQFTEMSSKSTPMQVIGLLNSLYTNFDEILTGYDVYKVETIGDAYMVASGLPIRNGTLHAREVACVALAFTEAVKNIKGIGHRSEESVQLRVGMHTGSCVAGVVGHTMPRYCLFGDTVNTASRMESSSAAQRIHISEQTKEVLDTFTVFDMELRGEMDIKGKGKQTTYWLLGQRGIIKPSRTASRSGHTPHPSSRIQSATSRKLSRSSNHTMDTTNNAVNSLKSPRNSLPQTVGVSTIPVIESI
ncbi:atrial natriuretic peptide receptor 1-like [Amphiura filiformis]|uniref:atrial natriuretic peptide receptor 1-like n=1 Tax=Amphiura filiformis TaxID=82378 RepID=UPI003B2235B2